MDAASVHKSVCAIATAFAEERRERQQRRNLAAVDFDRLQNAGFLLTGVPIGDGGIWESVARSARPICEMLRVLAHGDSSVALVCAMHPAVLNFWLPTAEAPEPYQGTWAEQRRLIFDGVRDGAWWGTIASEPGAAG